MFNGHGSIPELVEVHFSQTFVSLYFLNACPAYFSIEFFKLYIIIYIVVLFVFLNSVKGRLSDIYFAFLYELGHISVEECQKQSSDMGSVHVGIGHDDDFMVSEL